MARPPIEVMVKMGRAAMVKHRSKAEAVVWAIMAGPKRKKDLARTTLEHFGAGYALATKVCARMERAVLPPEDVSVFIVGTDPDFSKPRGEFFKLTPGKTHGFADLDAALHFAERYTLIGLVIAVWDREKMQPLAFSRPFIISNPAVAPLLDKAVKTIRMKITSDAYARETNVL